MKNDFYQNDNVIIDEVGWLVVIVVVQFVINVLLLFSC